MDDCPPRAKGFISGFMQQGYAFGYLIAVVFTRAIADTQSHKWRAMYWVQAGIVFLIAVSRLLLPQTNAFLESQLQKKLLESSGVKQDSFEKKAGIVFKHYWLLFIYLILLMSGFNFMSHGSQDLYPTYLKTQLAFSSDRATVVNCCANIGALFGGVLIGHFSNFLGRRLSIMICCVGGGALIYPWAFISNNGIIPAAIFLQGFTQGAFGVIPLYLSELSPGFHSFIVGMSYQLGNLASSASSTIESTIGEKFPIKNPKGGADIYDYGKVMAIFMGCVYAYVLIIIFLGPEKKSTSGNKENNKQFDMISDDEDVKKDDISNIEKIDNSNKSFT